MYSPKIREDLVPRIFHSAKATGLPMTTWVNQVLEKALPEADRKTEQPQNNRKDSIHEHSRD